MCRYLSDNNCTMTPLKTITSTTLRDWLDTCKAVSIIDIRPIQERVTAHIPQSLHFTAYDKIKAHNITTFHGLHLDKNIPVVVYCNGGKTSLTGAAMLQDLGYGTYSLKDGMSGWNLFFPSDDPSMSNLKSPHCENK